jgi:hypothetical protein
LKVDDERDDEDFKGLKNGLESSQCVCWVDLCENVVDLHIMRKHLNYNYWELQKIITFCRILQGGSCKGAVVLCKTCEAVHGELKCVVSFFMCCLFSFSISIQHRLQIKILVYLL